MEPYRSIGGKEAFLLSSFTIELYPSSSQSPYAREKLSNGVILKECAVILNAIIATRENIMALMETGTKSLGEMLGNGMRYNVPPYQRNYSWEQDHWEDLWEDIIYVYEKGDVHYMGAIVIKGKDNDLTLIDGQQRIVTLSILAISVIQSLRGLAESKNEPEDNEQRIQELTRNYIAYKDPASLKFTPKLFLNRDNNTFYQNNLVNFRPPLNAKKLKFTNSLLWDSYEYFFANVKKTFKTGMELAQFIQTVASKLKFITITVQDEVNAYTVFETLNARGKELTPTDLLKNYLLSNVKSDEDRKPVESQWNTITDVVGFKELPQFLRHFLNSRKHIVRMDRLFKEVKEDIRESQDVFNLLDELEDASQVYAALDVPTDELWSKQQKDHIDELTLFKVVQYKPLILASFYKKFGEDEITRLLKAIAIISFRYNIICGRNPNEIERAYNTAAVGIFTGKITSSRDALNVLEKVYVPDDDFKQAFSTKALSSNKKLSRYILCKLERQYSGADVNYLTSESTIEHILPQKPSLMPSGMTVEDHENYVARIGNMTILETTKNKDADNKIFGDKKKILGSSQYGLTKDLAKFEEWTANEIEARQKDLAKIATAVWRLEF